MRPICSFRLAAKLKKNHQTTRRLPLAWVSRISVAPSCPPERCPQRSCLKNQTPPHRHPWQSCFLYRKTSTRPLRKPQSKTFSSINRNISASQISAKVQLYFDILLCFDTKILPLQQKLARNGHAKWLPQAGGLMLATLRPGHTSLKPWLTKQSQVTNIYHHDT